MAQKANKINPDSIKLFGPVPRTIGTLITVLVVTSSFGLIGYRQLQSSHAFIPMPRANSSNNTAANTDYQVATTTAESIKSTSYPSNFQSRLIFFGALIVATVVLLFLLKLWA